MPWPAVEACGGRTDFTALQRVDNWSQDQLARAHRIWDYTLSLLSSLKHEALCFSEAEVASLEIQPVERIARSDSTLFASSLMSIWPIQQVRRLLCDGDGDDYNG
jgi:hypothetical protein